MNFSFETAVNKTTSRDVTPGQYTYLPVWKRALFRLNIARSIEKKKNDLLLYGATVNEEALGLPREPNKQQLVDEIMEVSPDLPWYLLDPEGDLISLWSIVLGLLLAYTALVLPVRIAFYETVFFDAWLMMDLITDTLFFVDFVINCFTSFRRSNGHFEVRLKVILLRYSRGWMFIDLFSSLPLYMLEYGQQNEESTNLKYNSLFRLLRVPRFYKVMRVFKTTKALRNYLLRRFIMNLQMMLHMNSRKFY
jgi:hypothetical protein